MAAIADLNYARYEVIVVDNRAVPDRSDWDAIEAYPNTRVVHEPRPGISAARNHGIALAAGEFVAFTDDDTMVDRNWLRALADRFAAEPDADAVTGLVLPGALERRRRSGSSRRTTRSGASTSGRASPVTGTP